MAGIVFTMGKVVKRNEKKMDLRRVKWQNSQMDDRQVVGNRLKLLRHVLGVSQVEFAASIDTHVTAISNIEHGRRGLPTAVALRIKRRWGIDPLWLWEGDTRNLPYQLARDLEAGNTTTDGWASGTKKPSKTSRA